MIRRPPRSTLPYTTLFRSRLRLRARLLDRLATDDAERLIDPEPALAEIQLDGVLDAIQPDRKSTRLNSSHANISYAVFCLKKKLQQTVLLPVDTLYLPTST